MSRLIICGREGRPERTFVPVGDVVTIGRSSENHIQIDDLNSSRHHCEIHIKDQTFELVDKDSRNGVFVNGHRVSNRKTLAPGDKLEIGTTVLYYDHVPGEETPPEAGTPGKITVDINTGAFPSADSDTPHPDDAITDHDFQGRDQPPERGEWDTSATPRPHDQVGQLRRLLDLNQVLNSELNLRRLLEKVMDTVVQVAGAERGFVILKLADEADFRVQVSRNIDQESIKDAREKISNSLVREVLETGKAVLVTDASQDSRYRGRESILSMKLRSILVVPMRFRDQVQGAIYLDNRFASNRFDDQTREHLTLVAAQAAVAIENARLFEENQRQREELEHAKNELERLNQLLRERVRTQDHELLKAREALAAHREEVQLHYNYDHIVTCSPKMLEVFMILDKVTDSSVPVLVQGESGTGKELIARALHYNGPRAKANFVSENCAAIPQHLMESEFFGYVRGAFTGANSDKMGLFEMADGGTLFLDEIGDMDMDLQTKLLRVLQDGVLRRVGSKEFKRIDVRIISATNKDLLKAIKDGRFREDLYYRLNVINVVLPTLRERKEDVPLLAEHFLQREARQAGHPPKRLTNEAADILLSYDWPGNVREMENEIMRASALSKEQIGPEHLSRSLVEAASNPAGSATGARIRSVALAGRTLKEIVSTEVDEIERQAITAVLKRTNYKKSKAAQILGISRPTLDSKIDKHGLTKDVILTDEANA